MSKSIYGRLRAGSGIKSTEDQYDIREDEEQYVKEEETLQLLLTAGYFRARIKTLSSFDKIIGGMTWCIQGCRFDIDIDLLFKENANVGKKIALTEKIVRVLKRMKCPHKIEPHQIQGADYIHIFPVVQWLVMQAIHRRDERMADMRRCAIGHFDRNKSWMDVDQDALSAEKKILAETVDYIENLYRPKRKYRKPEANKNASPEIQVQTTLLEYGRQGMFSYSDGDRSSTTTKDSQVVEDQVDSQSDEKKQIDSLMTGMTSSSREGRLTANAVSSILGMKSSEINQAVMDYDDKSADGVAELLKGLDVRHPHQREKAIESLKNQLEEMKLTNSQLTDELSQLEQSYNASLTQKDALSSELTQMETQMVAMETEVQGNKSLEELENLIALHEALKKQEQEFKASCKSEMEILESEIASLKDGKITNEENQELIDKLNSQCASEKQKEQQARLFLAAVTREVNEIERQVDDIPSQWETQQYQKRFLELYEQIEATYSENKRLYDRYNTEQAVKGVLEREVNLLNSIHDSFEKALHSNAAKEELLQQMTKICQQIQQLKISGENQREVTKASRDSKKEDFLELIERGRQYAKMVKEFQDLCRKQDVLIRRCAELGIEC